MLLACCRLASIAALLLLASEHGATAGGDSPKLARFSYEEPHLGTRCRLIFYAPNRDVADRAARAAFARIEALESIMSDYRQDSELMRLCAQAGGPAVRVSGELFTVLEHARQVSECSRGAFDVTVGPLTHLWRRAKRSGQLPDQDEIARARSLVDYRAVALDSKSQTVRLERAGMILDLGGIGKGYAADEMLATLRQQGITIALAAAGGDIAVADGPPGQPGWRIGIAGIDGKAASRWIRLAHSAISTSGDAEQFLDIDGERRSHIIDPHGGLGLLDRSSVTVIASAGIWADSLTKVGSIMLAADAIRVIEGFPGGIASISHQTRDGTVTIESKRFPKE